MSDVEYVKLLEKIVETVNKPGFYPKRDDDNTAGAKDTTSNCGLCNDGFATTDNVLFPTQFPERHDLKYFQDHQQCPFDTRLKKSLNGCFYTCYLFKHVGPLDVDVVKKMAADMLGKKTKVLSGII